MLAVINMNYCLDMEKWHLRLMLSAEMSFPDGSSLFHTSQRQAPFTWTFTEAVQFKGGGGGGAQGQTIGIVTHVMSHCSSWSSTTSLQLQFATTLSMAVTQSRQRDRSG